MSNDKAAVALHYLGHVVICHPNESLLDAMLRTGITIDFSCKSGICHRCLLRCVQGVIPEAATRKLPPHQQAAHCLLACQCHPEGSMVLAPKSPEDVLTRCVATQLIEIEGACMHLWFEPMRAFQGRRGQLAQILDIGMNGALMAGFAEDVEAGSDYCLQLDAGVSLPDWLRTKPIAGREFWLRGPLPVEPDLPLQPLPSDPALWDALGGDVAIRAVLETFYAKVYADPELAPFFERVTIDRIVGKQFAFLKENIQGRPVYLGEQPRNAHNWMVITDALFDHRQGLMHHAMREHGLSDDLIARWSLYEEQFRPEIVKYKPWPKRFGEMLVDTEQYEECLLEEATVCDYCGAEIQGQTLVRFHKRIGKLGCSACTTVAGEV